MTISVRTVGGVTILDVVGRMTAESSRERTLTLTVRHFLDVGHKQAGKLKLVYVSRHVDPLLRMTHLDRVLEMFDVEAEALASFGAGG